jgi:hypothetical protein
MEKKKLITKKEILKEMSNKSSQINENDIDRLFTKYMGDYQPDEFSPKEDKQPERKSQESDMGEGKLLTKFLTGK